MGLDIHNRPEPQMPQVVSANRLDDGIVVYLATGDRWVENISDAEVFEDKPAQAAGVARGAEAAAKNLVVDILPVDVEITPRGPRPKLIRDRIRAAGPTVRLDHGKQAPTG
jgi:hypothetical protein